MRYVVEGEWSGYTSGQRRIVHRELVAKKRAERLKGLKAIYYTDGTCLLVSVREVMPRESVTEIRGYSSLIRDAEARGESSVRVADILGFSKEASDA